MNILDRIPFREFTAALPTTIELKSKRHVASTLEARGGQRVYPLEAVSVTSMPTGVFIAPDLIVSDEAWRSVEVLLVAAPAAVGKSYLARATSFKTGGLLCDLAEVRLADAFFRGLLWDVFGVDGAKDIAKILADGRGALLVDAVDEALVAVGEESYKRALRDLAALLPPSPVGHPTVVIFGRPDTLQETAGFLEELQVSYANVQVGFFTQSQALDFVEAKANEASEREGRKFSVSRPDLSSFLQSFYRLVDQAFDLQDGKSNLGPDSFMGYAPVLNALSEFYWSEENPLSLLSRVQQDASYSDAWQVIVSAIDKIMERETEKFVRSVCDGSDEQDGFARQVFSPQNQLRLLLDGELGGSADSVMSFLEVCSPPGLPNNWVYSTVPQAIAHQVRDHPFLDSRNLGTRNPLTRFSNVVFRDFVVYSALVDLPPEDSVYIPDYWADPHVSPSSIFFNFAAMRSTRLRALSVESLTILTDSHAARFEGDVNLVVASMEDPKTQESWCKVSFLGDGYRESDLEVTLDGSSSILFSKVLSGVDIFAPHLGVHLGVGVHRFVIGPDVFILSKTMESSARELSVRGGSGKVNMLGAISSFGGAIRKIIPSHEGVLSVVGSGVSFPWHEYCAPDNISVGLSSTELVELGLILKRLIGWYLRPSLASVRLTYAVGAMASVLNKGRASREAHEFLVETGRLVRREDFWILDLGSVNVDSVMKVELTDARYVDLLREFNDWREGRGAVS